MNRKLDAIIFGATGFTGKFVVEDAVEILKDFTWAIAGRNKQKLEQLLIEVGGKVKKDLSHIPIVIAEVSDEKSIQEMAQQCRIVLNCCGPYEFYGEKVVKSCIEAGTHHVDISGEPTYIDEMQLKYHDWAKEKNCYVISTCAFVSIPADIGVVHAERNFDGTINSIDLYWENTFERVDLDSKAVLHSGTWESLIYSIKKIRRVLSLQNKMNAELKIPELRPSACMKFYIQKPDFASSYFIPMPFGDRTIVERSQRRLYDLEKKRPIQFQTYIGFRSLFWPIILPLYVPIVTLMALMPCCYNLLLKQSKFFTFGRFTHEGPTMANQNGHSFQMIFKATGWSRDQSLSSRPDKQQLTRVSGRCPFYGFTSIALNSAAKIILTESEKMPNSGGVLSPGAAFYRTGLIEELSKHKNGLKFEVLE